MGAGSDCSGDLPSSTSEVCPYTMFHGERGKNPEDYEVDHKLVTFEGAINEWTLYGGVPAKALSDIPKTAKYFLRRDGFVN